MLLAFRWMLFLAAMHTWPGWAMILGVVAMLFVEWLRPRIWRWQTEVLGR